MERHLEKKRNPSPPEAASPSPNLSSTPSVELSDEPVTKESPVVEEISDAMDVVEETVPEVKTTRNYVQTIEDASTNMMALENKLPPAILPITSPVKVNKREEVRLLLCASNKAAALKFAQKYPEPKYYGPHPSNKKHHFFISLFIDSENLPRLKGDVNELGHDFLLLHVVSENKNYIPEQADHCQACRSHRLKQ